MEVLDHLGEPMPFTDGTGPELEGSGQYDAPNQLFFSRDGDQLFSLYTLFTPGPELDERDTAIFSWKWADGEWVKQEPLTLPRVEVVALSLDACRLALVPRVSPFGGLHWREEMLRQPAVVSVFDIERRRSLGRIVRPPQGPLSTAGFLPEGKLLIEYLDGTIELLPWADLLGVPT